MDKGFFFTVDSFLALTFVTAVVLLSLFHMSHVQLDSWNSIDLRYASNDLLVVLEKSGNLENSFKLNSAGDAIVPASSLIVLEDLNNSPQAYCFELLIFRNGDQDIPEFHVLKPNCDKESFEFASVERPLVIVKGDIIQSYTVRLGGWRR